MDLVKNIPIENVGTVVSLARVAIVCEKTFDKVPEVLIRNLLQIFQALSVPSFNDFFKHLDQQWKI
jgi:hypothetical protein